MYSDTRLSIPVLRSHHVQHVLRPVTLPLCLIAMALGAPATSAEPTWEEDTLELKSFDDFVLPARVTKPAKSDDASISKVVILIHGSGPQDMDSTFDAASEDGKGIFLFRRLAHALADSGCCAVIRYHKRAYEWQKRLQKEPALVKGEEFKKAQTAPLKDLIGDVEAWSAYAQKRFPKAKIYLMGHSQGTFVGLQVAHKNPAIAGLAALGFMATDLNTLSFEQAVYRPLETIRKLDMDRDGRLSAKELSGKDETSATLRMQLSVLDVDGDGALAMTEINAASFATFLTISANRGIHNLGKDAYDYPPAVVALAKSRFKVAFFQGDLDNQTPSYQIRAIELLNQHQWKNDKLSFHFFPGLGHDLGAKKSYSDITYRAIDPKALERIVETLKGF